MHISPDETDYKITSEHNHHPNYGEAQAKLLISTAKRRAGEEPNLNPMHVTQDVLTQAECETLAALPKETSLKRAIQREKRASASSTQVNKRFGENTRYLFSH